MGNPILLLNFSEWVFLFLEKGGINQNRCHWLRPLGLPLLKGVIKKYVLIFSDICLSALYSTFSWSFSFLCSVALVCSVWILLSAASLLCQTVLLGSFGWLILRIYIVKFWSRLILLDWSITIRPNESQTFALPMCWIMQNTLLGPAAIHDNLWGTLSPHFVLHVVCGPLILLS